MDYRLSKIINIVRSLNEEMMTANAPGTSGGFGQDSDPKKTAGYDTILNKKNKMVRRSRIGTWAQTLRKK